MPVWTIRPYFRAASTIRRPSLTLWLTGFSTYTSLPAWQAQIVASACQWLGVATEMASIDLSSSSRRISCTISGPAPYRRSMALVARPVTFKSTSQILVMRTSFCLLQPATWSIPRPWTPQTATRSVSLGPAGLPSALSSAGVSALARPGIVAITAAIAALSTRNSRRGKVRMYLTLGQGEWGGWRRRREHTRSPNIRTCRRGVRQAGSRTFRPKGSVFRHALGSIVREQFVERQPEPGQHGAAV